MTVEIIEKLDGTRTGSIDASSGTRELVKNYIVTGTEDITVAIAKVDDEVPLWTETQIGTIKFGDKDIVVNGRYYGTKSWSKLDGTKNAWSFELTFSTAPDAGGGVSEEEGGSDGVQWIATQGDTRAKTEAVYRVDPVATDVDNPSPAIDIGGKKVDAGGKPITITMVDRRFTTTHKMQNFPMLNAYSNIVGKRNDDGFEYSPKGTVLYLGFSWRYDQGSGLWTVEHQFAIDQLTFHAEQVAKTDPQGDIIPAGEFEAGQTFWHALHVYWVQPFAMADFSVLPQFSQGG